MLLQKMRGILNPSPTSLLSMPQVRRNFPPQYLMHCDKEGLTTRDVLEMEYHEMHREAKR